MKDRFDAFFDAHRAAILGYLARRTAQPADAADLLAEVFMTAWRRMADVPDGTEARLWLFGVARNLLRNHRRGIVRHEQLAARVQEQLLAAAPTEGSEAADVRAALARLGSIDREVLTLAVWDDLEPSDIAALLSLPPGTVRVRMHRARRRLGRILRPPPATEPNASSQVLPSIETA
jgi:RNA polymerase sigma-70 factor (ECF subfamily)